MKTLIFIPIITLTVFFSCKPKGVLRDESVAVSVLIDITDTPIYILPEASTIIPFFEMQKNKDKAIYYKQSVLSDMAINPTIRLSLENDSITEIANTSQDPIYREKLIHSFCRKLKDTIQAFNTALYNYIPLKNSECFRAVTKELTLFKGSKVHKAVLLVYSDLQENSDLLNVYQNELFDTAVIKKKFEASNLLLDDLHNCLIVFIFQPLNREKDKKFNLMYDVYKRILEARGAKVVQFSNNP